MTPQQALDELERIEPTFLKNAWLDMLEWQIRCGKNLVHAGWYIRGIIYAWKSRAQRKSEAGESRGVQKSMSELVKATMKAK